MEGRIRVLHGVECEIKADGTLDYTAEQRAKFDIVLASLHMSLDQPRQRITERLINAIKDPNVRIIGHPRGRRYPDREPADLDMDAIFEAAYEHNVALEINANPLRLDLNAAHARRAAELGVKLTISTDAHHPDGFANMHYGVGTARRGWVTAEQVVNTWPLQRVLEWAQTR
jgi:DNA polymerase (family 10)